MTNNNCLFFSILILVLSGLPGCSRLAVDDSAETVYLYASGVAQRERRDLVSLLEAEGYRVIQPEQKSPFAGEGHTIVYYPFPGVETHLSQIVSTLNRYGYGVSNQYSKETGNHWYTEGNIGIYLDSGTDLSDSEEVYQSMKLVADLTAMEFDSEGCPGRHVYEFGKEGKLYYTDLSEKQDIFRTFAWREERSDYVLVEAEGEKYRYRRYESAKRATPDTNSGRMESEYVFTLNLEPIKNYPPPFGCHYMGEMTGFGAR